MSSKALSILIEYARSREQDCLNPIPKFCRGGSWFGFEGWLFWVCFRISLECVRFDIMPSFKTIVRYAGVGRVFFIFNGFIFKKKRQG